MKLNTYFSILSLLFGALLAQIDADVSPQALSTHSIVDMIHQYGYPCEEHTVRTHDGYILKIYRIPHGMSGSSEQLEASGRPPVLFQHGAFASSAVWLVNTPEQNLPFLLADSGFDVWLGNVRGNEYGRQHESLDPTSPEFWKFTVDEIAKYDFPAIVDYIMTTTESTNIQTVPHEEQKYQRKLPVSPIDSQHTDNQRQQPKTQIQQPKLHLQKVQHEIPLEKPKQIKGISKLEQMFKEHGIDLTALNQLLPGNCELSCDQHTRQQNEMNYNEMKNFFNSKGISLDSIQNFLPEQCEIRCPKETYRKQQKSNKMEKMDMSSQMNDNDRNKKRKQVPIIVPSSRSNRNDFKTISPINDVVMRKREAQRDVDSHRYLSIIAFGKGALVGLGQISRDPTLANQIKLFISLAPATGKSSKATAPYIKLLKQMDVSYLNDLKDQVFVDSNEKIDLLRSLPIPNTKLVHEYTSDPEKYLNFLTGEYRHVDKSKINDYLNALLSGTSKANLIHMTNMLKSAHGSPLFNLKDACVPVALFSGGLDQVSVPENIEYLRHTLPNVVADEVIDDYGHLDLLFADNLIDRVGRKIVKLLEQDQETHSKG